MPEHEEQGIQPEQPKPEPLRPEVYQRCLRSLISLVGRLNSEPLIAERAYVFKKEVEAGVIPANAEVGRSFKGEAIEGDIKVALSGYIIGEPFPASTPSPEGTRDLADLRVHAYFLDDENQDERGYANLAFGWLDTGDIEFSTVDSVTPDIDPERTRQVQELAGKWGFELDLLGAEFGSTPFVEGVMSNQAALKLAKAIEEFDTE